jgi:hypothetical protein
MIENFELMSINGGSVKVYTGAKNGKFIINKKGRKVYLNKKTIQDNLKYAPKKRGKKKAEN